MQLKSGYSRRISFTIEGKIVYLKIWSCNQISWRNPIKRQEKANISRKGDEQLDGEEGWDFHKYYDPKARNIN